MMTKEEWIHNTYADFLEWGLSEDDAIYKFMMTEIDQHWDMVLFLRSMEEAQKWNPEAFVLSEN